MTRTLLLCLLLAAGAATSATAATMAFDGSGVYADTDGDPFGDPDRYTENGITVTGFTFGELSESGNVAHLDNPNDGHFTDRLIFSFGNRFNLIGFDILPLGFECDADDAADCTGYENVIVTGFRRGLVVVEQMLSMGFATSFFDGAPLFADLDRLMIWTGAEPPGYEFGNSHFLIDNVALASVPVPTPVPVPPALPLLALGLLGLGFVARRGGVRPALAG